jgi:predicted house-cleaning NTP pyrophosphatase (Maf/HAM1 superfamily)
MKFKVVGSSFAEDLDKSKYSASQYPMETSRHKAIDIATIV